MLVNRAASPVSDRGSARCPRRSGTCVARGRRRRRAPTISSGRSGIQYRARPQPMARAVVGATGVHRLAVAAARTTEVPFRSCGSVVARWLCGWWPSPWGCWRRTSRSRSAYPSDAWQAEGRTSRDWALSSSSPWGSWDLHPWYLPSARGDAGERSGRGEASSPVSDRRIPTMGPRPRLVAAADLCVPNSGRANGGGFRRTRSQATP